MLYYGKGWDIMKWFYDSKECNFINLDKIFKVEFYWKGEELVASLDDSVVSIKLEEISNSDEKKEIVDLIKNKFENFLNGDKSVFDIRHYLSRKDIYNIKEFLRQ